MLMKSEFVMMISCVVLPSFVNTEHAKLSAIPPRYANMENAKTNVILPKFVNMEYAKVSALDYNAVKMKLVKLVTIIQQHVNVHLVLYAILLRMSVKKKAATHPNDHCKDNYDCNSHNYCENNVCKPFCTESSCNKNEVCHNYDDDTSRCRCAVGFARNSTSHVCEKQDCYSHDDCNNEQICRMINNIYKCTPVDHLNNDECMMWEKCINGMHLNLCFMKKCGQNEACFADKDTISCKCAPGFERRPPTNKCEKWSHGTTCSGRSDDYYHGDLCDKVSCGENEICQVHASKSTYSCECISGYARNFKQKCVKQRRSRCLTNDNCSSSEVCKNFECINACIGLKCDNINEYTLNACLVYNHTATCACEDNTLYDFEWRECNYKSYDMVC
ncbi:hypothetical protein PV327_004194 [Microctonus hyperodae]|uniref:EGF-like domain-containing protein n=1 Tax=Microctonus hyperodae TaxID=165561 RepID=A0AA39KMB6_MICHY|nr:hypothetical protein PV327_004194 [Microctonus hyperodae]